MGHEYTAAVIVHILLPQRDRRVEDLLENHDLPKQADPRLRTG
jgi:hypothetical protein